LKFRIEYYYSLKLDNEILKINVKPGQKIIQTLRKQM